MTISNKFILKSIESFNSGRFYQAVREFNSGLLRDIENNSFSYVEESLNAILPALEFNSLYHETEQIIQYYLTHLKKHKAVKNGFMPIITVLNNNFKANLYPTCTLRILSGFLDFFNNNGEPDIIDYMKNNSLSLLKNAEHFTLYQEVEEKIFISLIMSSLFQEAETMARTNFLNNLENVRQLDYILYSLIILAINGNLTESTKLIRDLRKIIPSDVQKASTLFQCCTEFLLASSGKDFDWVQELQVHFSESLKNKVVRLLIMNLIKKIFPEETKISIFDLFKQ